MKKIFTLFLFTTNLLFSDRFFISVPENIQSDICFISCDYIILDVISGHKNQYIIRFTEK